jgi:hypothetical protein
LSFHSTFALRLSALLVTASAISLPAFAQNSGYPTPQQVLAGWGGSDPWLDLNDDGTVDAADYAIAVSLQSSTSAPVTPSLSVGAGFTAATAQPPTQGLSSQPGYNAKAIARWNFVPHQTFDTEFGIGVVAFHAYGIDRVEFSLNGGPWTAVTEPSLNPMSNTVEYWVKVDPEQLATAEHEVRAIAYPQVGVPRVLGGALNGAGMDKGEYSMYFVADASATLPRTQRFVSPSGSDSTGNGTRGNPFQSIMKAAKSIAVANGGLADGGVINLLPGNHVYGTYSFALLTNTANRWLTIRPAPGVASSAAPIVSASTGGTNISHVRFERVTFKPSGSTNSVIPSTSGSKRLWVDKCDFIGVGTSNPSDWSGGWQMTWTTDCSLTGSAGGLGGELVRGLQMNEIGSDSFGQWAKTVINSSVRKITFSDPAFHPDFYQILGTGVENRVMYNVRCIEPVNAQGLFSGTGDSFKDFAFVGVEVDTRAPGAYGCAFQFGSAISHMLVEDSVILGPALWRVDVPGFSAENVVIRGTSWSGTGPSPAPLAGVTVLSD